MTVVKPFISRRMDVEIMNSTPPPTTDHFPIGQPSDNRNLFPEICVFRLVSKELRQAALFESVTK